MYADGNDKHSNEDQDDDSDDDKEDEDDRDQRANVRESHQQLSLWLS